MQTVTPPHEIQEELKKLGRLQYYRLRKAAATLHYYRIDTATIEDRLIERGCSREMADWVIRAAVSDTELSKRIEEGESPEPLLQVVLKGLNGLVMLVIVGIVSHALQLTQSMALLFMLSPALLITSFVGFFMMVRAFLDVRRRISEKSQ